MLRLGKIELKNFGLHEHFAADVRGNIIGLVGPSGQGKSTILQALQFAITGRIEHEDKLSEFIRRSGCAKPPKKAEVILDFEVDGKKCNIHRTITPTSTSRVLVIDGGAPITADKTVQETMLTILGVNRDAINSTVFIPQGSFAQMFGDEADRSDFYVRLLMVGHMSGIAEKIEATRRSVAGSLVDLGPALDEATSASEQATRNYEEAESSLTAAESYTKEIALLQDLSSATSAAERYEAEFVNAGAALRGCGVDELSAQSTLEDIDADITKLHAALTASETAVATHATAVANKESAELKHKALAETTEKFKLLTDYETQHAAVIASEAVDIKPIRDSIAEIERRLTLVDRIVYIDENVPKLAREIEERSALIKEHKVSLEAESGKCQQFRSDYKNANTELLKVDALLGSIAGSSGCTCEMCGSDNFTADYLNGRKKVLTEQRDKAHEGGSLSRGQADLLAKELKEFEDAQNLARIRHGSMQNERVGFGDTSGWVGKADMQLALNELQLTLEAVNKSNESRAGVLLQLTMLRNSVSGKSPVTDADIDACNAAKGRAMKELAVAFAALNSITANPIKIREMLSELQTRKTQLVAAFSRWGLANGTNQDAKARVEEILESCMLSSNFKQVLSRLEEQSPLNQERILGVLGEFNEMQADYNKAEGALRAAKDAMNNAASRVSEIQLRIAESAGTRKLVDKLAKLRAAFLPSGAVGQYLRHKFVGMAEVVSDYLASAGADFMVTPSETSNLAYDFVRTTGPDEVWMPQSRMSGGQRVRLAVATLLAIHAKILPNFGLLVLDEPTTHVHSEGVETMSDMFRSIGDSGHLQMVICDHNPILTESFTTTIEVGT